MRDLLRSSKHCTRFFAETLQRCLGPAAVCTAQCDFIIIVAATDNNIVQRYLATFFEIFFIVVVTPRAAGCAFFFVTSARTTRRGLSKCFLGRSSLWLFRCRFFFGGICGGAFTRGKLLFYLLILAGFTLYLGGTGGGRGGLYRFAGTTLFFAGTRRL